MNEETLYTNLIAGYLAGELTESEEQELLAWVNASSANEAFFEEMKILWEQAGAVEEPPFETNLESAWQQIERQTEHEGEVHKGTGIIRPLYSRTWLRLAAAIALLVTAAIFALQILTPGEPEWTAIETGRDQILPVDLPDGSRVWLNENSRIAFPEGFVRRSVRLEGEATFEVARDELRPFEVEAGGAEVRVLGTSFVVRAYPGEARVELTVKSGKVAFGGEAETRELKLEAGESAWFDAEEATVQQAETSFNNAEAWRTEQLTFSNEKIESVATTLERYFDLEVEFGDSTLLDCYYTGKFENPKLKDILDVWRFMFDWEIRQDGARVLIRGEGCN